MSSLVIDKQGGICALNLSHIEKGGSLQKAVFQNRKGLGVPLLFSAGCKIPHNNPYQY